MSDADCTPGRERRIVAASASNYFPDKSDQYCLTDEIGYMLCAVGLFISGNVTYCVLNASVINLMSLAVERYLKVVRQVLEQAKPEKLDDIRSDRVFVDSRNSVRGSYGFPHLICGRRDMPGISASF